MNKQLPQNISTPEFKYLFKTVFVSVGVVLVSHFWDKCWNQSVILEARLYRWWQSQKSFNIAVMVIFMISKLHVKKLIITLEPFFIPKFWMKDTCRYCPIMCYMHFIGKNNILCCDVYEICNLVHIIVSYWL